MGVSLEGVFISKLLKNRLAPCCLIKFDFLLSHVANFNNIVYINRVKSSKNELGY